MMCFNRETIHIIRDSKRITKHINGESKILSSKCRQKAEETSESVVNKGL
jgi:hypothetical protein